MSHNSRPLQDVWRSYLRRRRTADRNALAVHYLHLVNETAERLHRRLPSVVELDDLEAYGAFGLLHAIRGFDPGRGWKFETFAAKRIRGAMIDELRRADWAPRTVRANAMRLERVTDALAVEKGRPPTFEETRRRMKLRKAELVTIMADSSPPGTVSLDAPDDRAGGDDDDANCRAMMRFEADTDAAPPWQSAQTKEMLSQAMAWLMPQLRLVVVKYYFEKQPLSKIAAELQPPVTASRASQMHNTALRIMRQAMGAA